MKKSNYVLYRAIKRAAATAEELYDSYAEALEFAAETGYGLLDGSIDWDSLDPEELDFWAEAFAPEPVQADGTEPRVATNFGSLHLFLMPNTDKGIPAGALVTDLGFGPIVMEPNHPKGWEGVLEAELAAAAAPEIGRDVACTVLYNSTGVRRLRSPLDLKEGDEVMAKYWVEGNLYLVVEPDPES